MPPAFRYNKKTNRRKRLSLAVIWIERNGGKKIAQRYAKWFNVDLVCAIDELKMSGYVFEESEEKQMRDAYLAKTTQVARNQAEMEAALDSIQEEEANDLPGNQEAVV